MQGPARVVRSVEDAAGVRQGDVLVAETTSPSWTPLFATVVAVVTATGGVLSHSAIVAREYGIPAVVGLGPARSPCCRQANSLRFPVDLPTGLLATPGTQNAPNQ